MTSPSVPIKGLQEGQEDLAATDTGSLLRRGIKFSSQDAVNRFVNMPGKRDKKRKKQCNDGNHEVITGDKENPRSKPGSVTQSDATPPPPRRKKKKITDDDDTSTVDATHFRFSKDKLKSMLAVVDSPTNKSTRPLAKEQKSLTDKAKDRLAASRFRYLNEQLYTQTSAESVKMFKEDVTLFSAYHQGFQQQANAWPCDPLDRIISACQHLPDQHIVVDMGCGEARLARSITNKVHSFDLVAMAPGVVECDMSRVPLKNSSVQVVVFSLSLMGTNIKDFLAEASRILELGGLLKIAELESRFQGQENQFIRDVEKYGFELSWKDLKSQYFYFFDFKKIKDKANKKKMPTIQLKPCLYKKR